MLRLQLLRGMDRCKLKVNVFVKRLATEVIFRGGGKVGALMQRLGGQQHLNFENLLNLVFEVFEVGLLRCLCIVVCRFLVGTFGPTTGKGCGTLKGADGKLAGPPFFKATNLGPCFDLFEVFGATCPPQHFTPGPYCHSCDMW